MSRDLLPRIASSVVLIAVAAAAAWAGGIFAAIVVGAVVGAVHAEWSGVTEGGWRPALPFTIAVVLAILVFGVGFDGFALAIAAAALAAGGLTGPRPWRALGVVYASALGFGLLALRASPDYGLVAIALVVGVVAATDIGAFVAGRTIGGPKLWPRVSPKKTWSGAIGGLVAGVVVGLGLAAALGIPVTPGLVAVAIVLSIVGQLGDLFESHVKRRFGAKDSGRLVPGHGGMMDRVDGLVFASVAALAIGIGNGGLGNPAQGLVIW